MNRRMFRAPLRVAAVVGALVLAGCVGDDDELTRIRPPAGGDLFTRYVALGNSITAGLQSGGINDSLQVRAYPALLANRASAQFGLPLIARPGCPRPFAAPLGATGRIGTADSCFRINNPAFVQNLAVPGESIGDLVTLTSNPPLSALHSLLIGPRTQVEAMVDLAPTLVSVWIGNNDVLGVIGGRGPTILPGDTAALTPVASFQSSLGQIVEAIKQTPAGRNDAVILIGVVDVNVVPLIQPGAYYFLAATVQADGTRTFNGKPVNVNCSPVTALGQLNPLAFNLVNFQIVGSPLPEINCANTAPLVINAAERAAISNRVNAFNTAIRTAAQANGYLYVDPNEILAPFLVERTAEGRFNRIRKCQALATARTALEFQSAILNSCPVPGPTAAPNFFGSLFSFDGVHPSSEAHQVLANQLAARINTRFGVSLPTS